MNVAGSWGTEKASGMVRAAFAKELSRLLPTRKSKDTARAIGRTAGSLCKVGAIRRDSGTHDRATMRLLKRTQVVHWSQR